MFKDHEMTTLGGCKGHFRQFFYFCSKMFPGVSRYFSDGFWMFLDNFYFLRGKCWTGLYRAPWGPRGPIGVESPAERFRGSIRSG